MNKLIKIRCSNDRVVIFNLDFISSMEGCGDQTYLKMSNNALFIVDLTLNELLRVIEGEISFEDQEKEADEIRGRNNPFRYCIDKGCEGNKKVWQTPDVVFCGYCGEKLSLHEMLNKKAG